MCVWGGGDMGMGGGACLFVCLFVSFLYVLDSLFKNIDFNTILAYFGVRCIDGPGGGYSTLVKVGTRRT